MGTHVSEESWFGRIGKAFVGILFGGLLTVVSVPLLFWNEGRAVRTAKGLKEGAKVVVDIQPDSVESANDGKFVHTSGDVQTDDILRDDDFAIEFNGIRLTRHVEMFQWNENEQTSKEKKLGGGTRTTTTYTYEKDWFPGLIDSSEFDEAQSHQNPTEFVYADRTYQAKNVSLGQFRLPDSLVAMIGGEEALELGPANLPQDLRDRSVIRKDGPEGGSRIYIFSSPPPHQESTPAPTAAAELTLTAPDQSRPADGDRREPVDVPSESPPAEQETSTLRSAIDPRDTSERSPQIGDVRVWFTATPVQTVSLLSQQTGDSFQPFQTHYGTTINVLKVGIHSAAEMIAQEEAANRMLTWFLRVAGTGMMFFGLMLVLRPLVVLADVLPIAGSLVGFGTAIVAGLLTIAGAMTVIGIAWVFYRPLLGITLLVIAGAAIFIIFRRGRSKRSRQPDTLTHADLA
ncbi:TMEM43 family protein [Stieleria mannarensis]|uniref:TMEM43 family protein n=1 Tax=Stieleria mannarensis TaxID=2755585 RepID=UPI001602153E|nr:TMEM43 family protein [Rhodopirellula sp. JC639]